MRYHGRMKGKRIAIYGLLVALAFVLSYIESLFPVSVAVPGAKLGLTNLVVLIALYRLSKWDALWINVVRIVLVGLTFGNAYSFLYSIAGGVLSFFVMLLFFQRKTFGKVGVSVAGGVSHNIGQVLVAVVVLRSVGIFSYLPVLLLAGIVAGVAIGVLSGEILKRLPADL